MVAVSATSASRASLPLGVYVGRIHKQVNGAGNVELSDAARRGFSAAVASLTRRLATEAGRLAKQNKAQTISSKHALAAVRLVVAGELGKHARAESLKALTKHKA